jgi:hypothetical protein
MAALTIKWTRQAITDVDNVYDFIAATGDEGDRRQNRSGHHQFDRTSGLGRSGAYEGRESSSSLAPHSSWPTGYDTRQSSCWASFMRRAGGRTNCEINESASRRRGADHRELGC